MLINVGLAGLQAGYGLQLSGTTLSVVSGITPFTLNGITGNVTLASSGGNIVIGQNGSTIYIGETGLASEQELITASGYLQSLIQSAAGVLSVNGQSGLLTLTGPATFNNYVGVSTAGTTISVTGSPTPAFSGVTLGFSSPNLPSNGLLQLATHTTSGGGIGFGPATSLYSSAAGVLSSNARVTMLGLTVEGSTAGIVNNGLYVPGAGQLGIASNGVAALTFGSTQAATFTSTISAGATTASALTSLSGIFFRDTGNYTPSGAASVAQLLAASGWLTNASTSNVVYTTGDQTVTGVKTFVSRGIFLNGPFMIGLTGDAGAPGANANGFVHIKGTSAPLNRGVGTPVQLFISNSATGQVADGGGRIDFGGYQTPLGYNYSYAGIVGAAQMANGHGGYLSLLTQATSSTLTEVMRLTPSGNVGVGTSAPAERFHVSGGNFRIDGNLSITGARAFIDGPATAQYISISTVPALIVGASIQTANNLAIGPGSNAATIQARNGAVAAYSLNLNPYGGNVGVGMEGGAGLEKLHVSGGSLRVEGSGFFRMSDVVSTDALKVISIVGGLNTFAVGADASRNANLRMEDGGGNIDIRFDTNGSSWFNGGSLGVGTIAPQEKVHVSGGNLRVDGSGIFPFSTSRVGIGTLTPTNGILEVQAASNNAAYLASEGAAFAGTVLRVNATNAASTAWLLNLRSNSLDRVVVEGGGNMGVGTTTPTERLHISGNARVDGNLSVTGGRAFIDGPNAAQYTSLSIVPVLTVGASNQTAGNLALAPGAAASVIQARDGATTAYALNLNPFGGNVGVGTAAAAAITKLDIKVATDRHLQCTSYGNGAEIYAGSDADTYTGLYLDGSTIYLGNRNAAKVGVGTGPTFVPAELLHVSGGNFRVDGTALVTSITNGDFGLTIFNQSTGTSATSATTFVNDVGQIGSLLLGSSNIAAGFEASRSRLALTSVTTAGISIAARSAGDIRFYTVGSAASNERARITSAGNFVGSGSMTARSYAAAVSGAAIPLIGASLTGTFNVDFTNSPGLQTLTITGSTLFSGVNYVAGAAATIRVNVSGNNYAAVRFPEAWNAGWVTDVPTGLATGRFAVLTLNTFAAADSGVMIAWAVRS